MSSPIAMVARALALRCPNCGLSGLFTSWFSMRPGCPACGLITEREEGYFLGAIMLNLVVAELLFAAGLLVVVLATWPNPPWTALWIGSMVGIVVVPIVLYPFSKSLWLAVDLMFRPGRFQQHQGQPEGDPRGG
jgi:uncharacterized protein (DUF983 family)